MRAKSGGTGLGAASVRSETVPSHPNGSPTGRHGVAVSRGAFLHLATPACRSPGGTDHGSPANVRKAGPPGRPQQAHPLFLPSVKAPQSPWVQCCPPSPPPTSQYAQRPGAATPPRRLARVKVQAGGARARKQTYASPHVRARQNGRRRSAAIPTPHKVERSTSCIGGGDRAAGCGARDVSHPLCIICYSELPCHAFGH